MAVKNSDRSSERLGIKLAVVIGCKIALITVIFFLFFAYIPPKHSSDTIVSTIRISSLILSLPYIPLPLSYTFAVNPLQQDPFQILPNNLDFVISESEFVATNLQTTAVSAILFFVSKDVGYEFPFRILLPSSILPPVPLPSVVLSLSSTCPTVYKLVPSINQTDFVE